MRILAVFLLLAIGTAQGAFAQTAAGESMAAFWPKFQAAVGKSDAEGVASMTQLPFLLDGKNLDQAKFVKAVPGLFSAKIRGCIAQAKTVKSKDGFDVFCGQQIFVFERKGGKFVFAAIGVND